MSEKMGGIYKIADAELFREMIEINSSGRKCRSWDDFSSMVFPKANKNNQDKPYRSRYVVCIMPCEYEHDLDNESGCASPVDAAESCVNTMVNDGGLTVRVWDRHTELCHFIEANEYIYKSLPSNDKSV